MSQAAPANQLPVRLAQLARTLESRFLGKEEVIRLLLIATVAGEHAVLIGPPGTAKSALIRTFAKLLQARYFESLLTLLNDRKYTSGGQVLRCPILSCFGASNEVPNDETLTAIFDRFLLRIRSDNLDAYHFQDLLTKGVQHEIMALTDAPIQPLASAREI